MSRFFVPLPLRVKQDIQRRQLLLPGQRLLLALSGGQDSWCLWHLLNSWQQEMNWHIHILHCNHRWSEEETHCALALHHYFQQRGIPFAVATAETVTRQEAQARAWRYQQYAIWAEHWDCERVVTGHTGSDWAETVLLNLLRGSGHGGLSSLAWQRPLSGSRMVVRPLLRVWRQETAAYCQAYGLPVWADGSNQDRRYKRNRLRLEVMPYLRQHFNPQVEGALVHHAMLSGLEHDWVVCCAQGEWQQVYQGEPPRLHRQRLATLHGAVQGQLLWEFLRQHLPTTPGFEHVEWLKGLITAPQRSRTPPFPGGWWVEVRGDWLVLRGSQS
ncbi:MAG: tRNA lysidine(34) synthetase TilS [Thermostichales cyanobacterium BF3_bins_165]